METFAAGLDTQVKYVENIDVVWKEEFRIDAAFEIENMNWTEVIQSDDAQLALKTCIAVDPESRRDWFESESSKSYPAYSGH